MTSASGKAEMVRYTKYYEMDGRLRAYANRMMLLATLFALVAVGSLSFAVYLHLQPATVIRVDSSGNAIVLSGRMTGVKGPSAQALTDDPAMVTPAGPSDVERRAVVIRFLDRYLAYTPAAVAQNLSDALNMMTPNFRKYTFDRLKEAGTVQQIKEANITSEFRITRMEYLEKTRWTYLVHGYKELHYSANSVERIHRIVGQYRVRLQEVPRSVEFPNGVAIAEYSEAQAWGDQETGLLQQSSTDKQR